MPATEYHPILTEELLKSISTLKSLEYLTIRVWDEPICDLQLKRLLEMPNLKYIGLHGVKLSESGEKMLKGVDFEVLFKSSVLRR